MKHDSVNLESLFLSLTDEEKQKAIDHALLLLSENGVKRKV